MSERGAAQEQVMDHLQRSYRDVCEFYEWAQSLEASADERQIVYDAARIAQRIVDYQACALIERVNGEEQPGDCFLTSGAPTQAVWAKKHAALGAIAWSVQHRQPLVLPDADRGSFVIIPFFTASSRYVAMDLRTPFDTESITQHRLELLSLLSRRVTIALENVGLIVERIRAHQLSTTAALVRAVDAKDPYTQGHSERVMQYTLLLCDQLLDRNVHRENARLAGLLHDIGKIGMRDNILFKESRLTEEEFQDVRKHPLLSARILEATTLPDEVIAAVRHHHERWDGTGYPDGLRGEEIPLLARIIAIVDAFDAMTSTRAYRSGMTCAAALHEITARAGAQYDPELARSFADAIGQLTPDENLSGISLAACLIGSRSGCGTTMNASTLQKGCP
jgi:putative nucleotidyltransferase with HDIG domain